MSQELEKKWQRATWDGVPGYAQRIIKEQWDFSVTLPNEADPSTVHLNVTPANPHTDAFTWYSVSYKIKDKLEWELLRINEDTHNGNSINKFTAHIGNFADTVGPDQIDNSTVLNL